MRGMLSVFEGATGSAITDTIRVEGAAVDLIGMNASVKFRMRLTDSPTLKVDADATIDQTGSGDGAVNKGQVHYSWVAADLDTPGKYRAWWTITASGFPQDSPEFDLEVIAHDSGTPALGAVALGVKRFLPATFAALDGNQNFDDDSLQHHANVVKYTLFATVLEAHLEATVYDLMLLDFMSKMTALRILPAAADYWSTQASTLALTGTNESVSYPDRVKNIWDTFDKLAADVTDTWSTMDQMYGFVARKRSPSSLPALSHGSGDKVTIDPHEFGELVGSSATLRRVQLLPWNYFEE